MALARRTAPSGTAVLRGPNDVGRLALYPDGTVHAHINDLARIVWPQKNFRDAVKRKAAKAHDAGDVARVPPMADDILVELGLTEEYLGRWAHRDARAPLAAFDFTAWRQRAHRFLATYASREQSKLRGQIDGLQAACDRWAVKEAAFLDLADA